MAHTIKPTKLILFGWFQKLKFLITPFLFTFSLQAFAQGYTTVDWHQAQNDRNGAKTYNIDWVAGVLNSTHTDYWEGIGVPQRLVFTGIKPNTPNANPNKHSVRFQVFAQKGGKHAFDFPMSWEQAVKTAEDIGGTVNELQHLFSQKCDAAFSAAGAAACATLTDGSNDNVTLKEFPDNIGNPAVHVGTNVNTNIRCFEDYVRFGETAVRYGNREIELRGNQAISNVEVEFTGYKDGGDMAEYRVSWVSSSDIIMIRFATRLAPGNGRCGYGAGNGAGSINGAPYHVVLEAFDDVDDLPGVTIGSQDNQIMSGAIQIPPPQCALSSGSSGCTNTATSFTVNYTSADAAGATVKFYFTANTAGAKLPNGTTAVGNCTTSTYSVVADGGGNASVNITPAVGTSFTAGSFRIGACVTGAGGSTTCIQPTATTIDAATVEGRVAATAAGTGSVTTLAAPFELNILQATPQAFLKALASLNGTQNNALFTSFTWAVASGVTGNNATLSNLSATNTANVTFTPTAAANPPGGYVSGIYAFEVTAVSTANGCTAKATVYINASGTASCPGVAGPAAACESQSGLTYTTDPAGQSPGSFLTYVWSINGTATIVGAAADGTKSGVNSISVTAGTSNFKVILSIRADNGQLFTFTACEKSVTVTPRPTVAAIYNPPGCSDKTFTVDVVSPKGGYTYSIDQPGNTEDFSGQDQTPAADGDPVQFTGLLAGDGFIVTVNANVPGATCTGSTNCASSTNSCDAVTEERGIKAPVTTTPKNLVDDTYKIILESPTKVKAVPNPYTDKVRFDLVSGVSGYGSLELYNMLGQRIGVVYQGYIQAGRPFIREYAVAKGSRNTLIYVFKVGDQKVTGRLIGTR